MASCRMAEAFLDAADGPVLVFGGPYSNLPATRAVFAAAAEHGIPPGRMICTGDVVAYGADPQACVELIRARGVVTVMGNCEEQLAADAPDCGCGFAPGSACDTAASAWFGFARARIDGDARHWMAQLPRRVDLLIGGRRFAVVHGAPSRINRFVFASDPDALFAAEFDAVGPVDGVIAGHCGLGFTRGIGGRIWHNAGAIGLPANDGTPRGWYSVLTPQGDGLRIETYPLAYDHRAAAEAMRVAGLPDDYATAIETGIWPSLDILPLPERAATATVRRGDRVDLPGAVPDRAIVATDAVVAPDALETLWVNTGTLCNLTCAGCYIESSPTNDRLAYFGLAPFQTLLDEARRDHPALRTIGLTGGEPFMNPAIMAIIGSALAGGYDVLVLTNAMRPMQRHLAALIALREECGSRLQVRVSLDHFTASGHEALRGKGAWAPAIAGVRALVEAGFEPSVAARFDPAVEDELTTREGFAALFAREGFAIDAADPAQLVLFAEMSRDHGVPGVSAAAWRALRARGADAMCRTARMAVQRRGETAATIVACTLLPEEERFSLGRTLAEAMRPVRLDHPYCAQFCVFGASSCMTAR